MEQEIIIYRLAEVKKICGLGRSSIYSMIKNGRFPQSIAIGKRARGWVSYEIHTWLQDRIGERAF